MALYGRSNPVGIDIPIRGFQKFLYNQVKSVWNIQDDSKYRCYDRAYNDLIDKGYVPRVISPNTEGVLEYQTISFDETLDWAVSFFNVSDRMSEISNRSSRSQVGLIFAVNLEKIKPAITGFRGDEEARVDIAKICFTPRFEFELTGIDIGYENVFKEYKGLLTPDRNDWRDYHPLHVFRINFDLTYALEDCFDSPPNSF